MSMVLVSEVFVAIVHILAGIDVEILLLGICNLENISLDGGGVLSKVGTDEWFVHWSRKVHEATLEEVSKSNHGGEFPSKGHSLHIGVLGDDLKSEPEASEPGDLVVSQHSVVK